LDVINNNVSVIDFLERNLFSCTIKSLTGYECPGCGMQRAFIALLKGDLASSFAYNPSLIPFLITILFTISHLILKYKNGARMVVILFSSTVAVMVGQFIIKLILKNN
jgi:hypothetical protein